ncbi:MAG: ABC transporter ATP-binding protein [Pseudomonadota bacterium]|uniref:ABC transporter ATP-binding protein n=1 Tax=Gallaecimonas pentaromativorans TaxID=584787 RepID=UPI00067EA18F|nr:ABC transporter ATP-binding protein [Gallaecimonas pentaromativorans]MED5526310.1 ABC transporter ATP-binding protein [Pseudomonadota bacterium]
MTEPLIKIENLSQTLGKTQVLKSVSSSVGQGEVIGILGLNGAGKTSLCEALLGFRPATSGSVTLFGTSVDALPGSSKLAIGYVPQKEELLTHLTAEQNLKLFASFYPHWDWLFVEQLAEKWQVPLAKKVNTLSEGQRQKLSIITALGHHPRLLVLDEPVASLDPLARRQFISTLIDEMTATNCTVLFSSHIVSDLERIASRVWILKAGKLIIDETLDTLQERVARINRASLFEHQPVLHEFNDGSLLVVTEKPVSALPLEQLFVEIHQ